MKFKLLILATFIGLFMVSCSSVRVATDYDTKVDFNKYKTFAFYKKGIDKAEISDLDKKRIMRAIESELKAKGMKKSNDPDVLISLFTKTRQRVNVNDNFYGGLYGGFYYPWYYGHRPYDVTQYTEGTLFIDLIDTHKKELLWQGVGTGAMTNISPQRKVERINKFVKDILTEYPPNK